MNKTGLLKKRIILWMAIGIIAILYLIFILCFYKCPSSYLFGISCPGCGLTRAYYAMLRFDFAEAFHFHPLFFLYPLAVIFFIISKIFKFKWATDNFWAVFSVIIIAITLIVYLIRLLSHNDIVYFDPSQGLITGYFIK